MICTKLTYSIYSKNETPIFQINNSRVIDDINYYDYNKWIAISTCMFQNNRV